MRRPSRYGCWTVEPCPREAGELFTLEVEEIEQVVEPSGEFLGAGWGHRTVVEMETLPNSTHGMPRKAKGPLYIKEGKVGGEGRKEEEEEEEN